MSVIFSYRISLVNHGTSLVKPGRIRYRAYSLQIGVQLELQGTYSIGQHRARRRKPARILITQLTGRARLNFILENSLAHPSPTGSARATRLDKERCHEPACPSSCPGPGGPSLPVPRRPHTRAELGHLGRGFGRGQQRARVRAGSSTRWLVARAGEHSPDRQTAPLAASESARCSPRADRLERTKFE